MLGALACSDSLHPGHILHKLSTAQTGLLLLTIGAVIDSSSGLFTRLITADNFTVASGRSLAAFACLICALAIRERGRIWPSFAGIGKAGIAFALLNGAGMVMTILSLRHTSVANFFMISATAPFVAGLLGWLILRERLDRATALAALAGFAGIAIMMTGKTTANGQFGDLLALACVLTYSAIVLLTRGARFDILPVIALTCLVSGLMPLPWADFASLTLPDASILFLFGAVQIAIGNLFIFAAASRIPPAQSGLLGVFNAALAPLWVFLALGDVPATASLIGGGIVLAAAIAHLGYTLSRPQHP